MTDSMLLTGLANTDSVGAIDELATASALCTPAHRVSANASGDDNGGCVQVEGDAPRRRSGGGGTRVRCRSASEDSQEGADGGGGGATEQRLYPRRPKIHVERARLERQTAVVGALHGSRSRREPAAGPSGGEPASDASDEGTHDDTSFSSRSPSLVESDAEAHV